MARCCETSLAQRRLAGKRDGRRAWVLALAGPRATATGSSTIPFSMPKDARDASRHRPFARSFWSLRVCCRLRPTPRWRWSFDGCARSSVCSDVEMRFADDRRARPMRIRCGPHRPTTMRYRNIQPRLAESVAGEQAMDISSLHVAIGRSWRHRRGPRSSSSGRTQSLALAAAKVNLIPLNRRAGRAVRAGDPAWWIV